MKYLNIILSYFYLNELKQYIILYYIIFNFCDCGCVVYGARSEVGKFIKKYFT